MGTTAAGKEIHEYAVVPLARQSGESDEAALQRILSEQAQLGWQVVDSCGDEVRRPVLIFRKLAGGARPTLYTVERVPHIKGQDDIADVRERLWKKKEEGWIPACVLDSPVTPPVAVFRKAESSTEGLLLKVSEVSPTILEKIEEAIVYELLDQQVRDNLTAECIMHGGVNPVLILLTKDTEQPFEYLVEHAKGGLFKNQTSKLTALITARAAEGWQVCGAFEDSFFWPCVVFRRPAVEMPVTPREVAEQVNQPEGKA